MIEDDQIDAESITLLPPTNACSGDLTDEDSGDEDLVNINNLPASQMQSKVEVNCLVHPDDKELWSSDDELPLSEISNKNKKEVKKKKFYHFIKEDLPPDEYVFPHTDQDIHQSVEGISPTSLFFQFFDDNILIKLVEETNRYAQQKNKNVVIDISELKCFFAILLLSGYVPVSRRRMFWENAKDTHNVLAAEALSRNKFEHILSHIHVVNNSLLNKNDKFAKLRPLFEHLNNKFLEYAPAEEYHSIDEAMVAYYGRHGCKQYIHGKPIRYGYKLWVGTTRLGYINWFEPYQGAGTYVSSIYKHLGVGTTVVLTYADRIRQKWPSIRFHFFFDNFFTSPALLEQLSEKNIRGSGTIRENRIARSTLKDSKTIKNEARGAYDFQKVHDSNIVFVKWNDNNIVTFCSNASGVHPLHSVKRYSQKEKKFINIEQPHVVSLYNKYMGGVDRSDQNMEQYRVGIRGKKWYFPLISHCVNMSVHNAWYIHRNMGGTLDQLAFRRSIVSTILEQNKKLYVYQKGRPGRVNNEMRYDRMDHFVIPQTKQTRCGQCHEKTTTRCRKCDLGVHVKCFVMYHTP